MLCFCYHVLVFKKIKCFIQETDPRHQHSSVFVLCCSKVFGGSNDTFYRHSFSVPVNFCWDFFVRLLSFKLLSWRKVCNGTVIKTVFCCSIISKIKPEKLSFTFEPLSNKHALHIEDAYFSAHSAGNSMTAAILSTLTRRVGHLLTLDAIYLLQSTQ